MKILAIRVHQLASILDAEVDFSASPLKEAGLFWLLKVALVM